VFAGGVLLRGSFPTAGRHGSSLRRCC
jgi:hypothetical protein